MSYTFRPSSGVSAAALLVALCGCGGGGDSGEAPSPAGSAPSPAPAPPASPAPPTMPAPSRIVVNCAAFAISGDATSQAGARWTYLSTDDGVEYDLSGVLFAPSGSAPLPGVVVSHGFGGSATGYSSQVARTMRDWG